MALLKDKDPMGLAIAEYHTNKKKKKLWVNSDITDKDEIPVKYLFRSFKQMPHIEQQALKICKGNILDVGAAAGSHSLWLMDNGFDVLSIDISQLAVQTMKERGVDNAFNIDFCKFTTEHKYDTLLFLMNGAGIAGTLNGLPKLLNKCSELLNENGQILIDSSDINYMFDDDEEKPVGKYYGEVEYTMSYDDSTSDPFSWLFVSFDMLNILAQSCGLNCELICEGDNYDYLARLKRDV